MKCIKPTDLDKNGIIIDLLSDKSYEKEHLKGALNFSIYETAFPNKILDAFPDKSVTLYIYGLSDDTKEAERAYYVLQELWYENTFIIEAWLKECKNLKLPIVEGKPKEELNWKYIVLSEKSRIEWTWRNIWNKHTGDIKIKNWYLLLDKWEVIGWKFEIDMTTINNFDLKDPVLRNMLVGHLKSKDFFDVTNFPITTLDLLKLEKIDDVQSMPNYRIRAKLTIKWITKDIIFEAHIHEKEEQVVINAHLDLDRSKWNIMYWSAKFFARLWNHIVDDIISIDMIIFAEKKDK